jgi:hypothetical protein
VGQEVNAETEVGPENREFFPLAKWLLQTIRNELLITAFI